MQNERKVRICARCANSRIIDTRQRRKLPNSRYEIISLRVKEQFKDEIDRMPVEGKFGQAKRRFGLGFIPAKLAETSKSAIHISFIKYNGVRASSLRYTPLAKLFQSLSRTIK